MSLQPPQQAQSPAQLPFAMGIHAPPPPPPNTPGRRRRDVMSSDDSDPLDLWMLSGLDD
jgi:hypothetical protein